MKLILDNADILIIAPFFLGYLWAADVFCKKFLGASKRREWLFMIFSFCGCLFCNIVVRFYSVSYILSVMLSQIFFMGLVMLLFQSDKEKRILAASMLMLTARLAADFCNSFLSCLALFFYHAEKKDSRTIFGGVGNRTNQWCQLLFCHIGYTLDVKASCVCFLWQTREMVCHIGCPLTYDHNSV